MRFEPRRLPIDPKRPFAEDAAELKSYADSLTNVFRNTEGSCVAALDAPWGQGKTTFLDMWRHSYGNTGGKVIWFNAWTNDHCEDILIALIDELGRQLETDNRSKSKLQALRKVAKDIIVRTIPLAARVATGGLVNIEGFDEFVESMAQQKLNDYAKAKESIDNFRTELQAFIEKNSEDDLPVVVVIDELDRCRPSFAIETLETIKHLFEVDNLIFVLGVDLRQLEHAIRGVYGAGFSADVYLHRFFNIRLSLPEPPVEPMITSFLQRLDLTEELGKKSRGYLYSKSNIPEVLAECARQFDFSLRDLERIATTSGLYTAAPLFVNIPVQ